jgi:hypothetical protein
MPQDGIFLGVAILLPRFRWSQGVSGLVDLYLGRTGCGPLAGPLRPAQVEEHIANQNQDR